MKKSFGEIQIYDVKGFLIKQLSSDGDTSISLPDGMYIVKVKIADSAFIEKILVN